MHPLLAASLANSLSSDRVGAARSRRTAKAAQARRARAIPRPARSSSGARAPPTPRRSSASARSTATTDAGALLARHAAEHDVLVAEVDGRLEAALAVDDGLAVADPFRPSAVNAELLALRARQLGGVAARDGHRSRLACCTRTRRNVRAVLPPGPSTPSAVQTWEWLARPTTLLRRCAARYGEPFTLRTAWTDAPMVVVSDPAAVRAVFTAPVDVAIAGASSTFLEPFVGPSSILVLDGPAHLRQRKLMLPPFHGDRMRAHRELIAGLAAAEVERWPAGEPFATHGRMQALTLDIIMRVVFGAELPELRTAIRRTLDMTMSLPRMLFFSLTGNDLGFRRALDSVEAGLTAVIRERRAARRPATRSSTS